MAEQGLQHVFTKAPVLNGLLIAAAVVAAYLPIRELPDRRRLPDAEIALVYRPVALPAADGPLRLAGAWQLRAADPRLGGVSALAIDGQRFLGVTDRGAVLSFDPPGAARPTIWLSDLRAGPGPFASKWARDAESLALDPRGRGWWVGYEQNHSLWLYDPAFTLGLTHVDLANTGWRDNRGAEGLLATGDHLLVTAENGRDAVRIGRDRIERLPLNAGVEVADAATAPDGSGWLLLRSKSLGGIEQAIVPLTTDRGGLRIGTRWPLPKGAFDNFEGMAIEPRPSGGWRFWLITDDGHRIMARTLLVALDLDAPIRNDKSPARRTGLSRKSQRRKR